MGFFNPGAGPSQVGINSIEKPSIFNKEYLLGHWNTVFNVKQAWELKDSVLVPQS